MGALGDRFGHGGFLPAVALLALAACSGAAPSDLNNPPESESGSSSGSGHGSGKGSGSSSGSSSGSKGGGSGGASGNGDDMADATVDDAGDDVSDGGGADETEVPEASACAATCSPFQMCCSIASSNTYGKCYTPGLCFGMCCLP